MTGPFAGRPEGKGRRVAIAVARFNDLITQRLESGARDTLLGHGVAAADITTVSVPGAFELPLTCKWLAESGRYDAVIALGAVVRGATAHFEHVAGQAAAGLLRAGLDTGVPILFGVLTCDTVEQALERSGAKDCNKGADVAEAALTMASLRRALSEDRARA